MKILWTGWVLLITQNWSISKKGLSSNDLYLSEIFTSRQISLINEMFGDEFEYFKYPMAKGDM